MVTYETTVGTASVSRVVVLRDGIRKDGKRKTRVTQTCVLSVNKHSGLQGYPGQTCFMGPVQSPKTVVGAATLTVEGIRDTCSGKLFMQNVIL